MTFLYWWRGNSLGSPCLGPQTAALELSEDKGAAGKWGCQLLVTFDLSTPMAERQLSARLWLDVDSSWLQREKGREVQTAPMSWGQKEKVDIICLLNSSSSQGDIGYKLLYVL